MEVKPTTTTRQKLISLVLLVMCWAAEYPQSSTAVAIQTQVDVLVRLTSLAEGYHNKSCNALANCATAGCSVPGCGNTFAAEKGFECNGAFGLNPSMCGTDSTCRGLIRSTAESTVRFAPGTDFAEKSNQAFMCTMKSLDADLKKELESKKVTAWQYIANTQGLIRMHPGAPQDRTESACGSYDPRARPWYMAATSGPKDVVLVLDISGSMNAANAGAGKTNPETRISALKKAVRSLLNTFTEVDYVSIVTFANTASVLGTPTPTTLLRATKANIAMLDDDVDFLLAQAATNTKMAPAFAKAFDVLAASTTRTTGCSRILLFLTDGVPSDGATVSESQTLIDSAIAAGQARMGTNRAHIFTYTFGDEANVDIPRAIACANNGVWTKIASGADPFVALRGYYRFLALGTYSEEVRWTPPYIDAFGLGEMVTAAKPVYDKSTSGVPLLAAVVGVDVPMEDLNPDGSKTVQQIVDELVAVGKKCPTVAVTDCHLQLLRQEEGYVCPSGTPVDSCPSGTFLEACGRPNLGSDSINTYLCESLAAGSRVSDSGTVRSDANVMCCGNCGGSGGTPKKVVSDGQGGLGAGALAGIVVGGVVFFVVVGVVAVCVVRKRPAAPHQDDLHASTVRRSSSSSLRRSSTHRTPQPQQGILHAPTAPAPAPPVIAPVLGVEPPPVYPSGPGQQTSAGSEDFQSPTESPPTYQQAVMSKSHGEYRPDEV